MGKNSFKTESKRCKIQAIEKFDPDNHWSIDRWWTREEKIELGIMKEELVMTLEEFLEKSKDVEVSVHKLTQQLKGLVC